MGEKIGYARVSTREQNLSSQVDALNNAGCIRIFTDKISGKEFKREGLTACLDYLRADDTLVIYRLDRLGRSVKDPLKHPLAHILICRNENTDGSCFQSFREIKSPPGTGCRILTGNRNYRHLYPKG